MSDLDKLRNDWEWWRKSPHREKSTVTECFREADALIAALEAEVKTGNALLAKKTDQHMEEHTARLKAEAEVERLRERLAICDACHEPIRVRLPNVRERAHAANVAALEKNWHEAEERARKAEAEVEFAKTTIAANVGRIKELEADRKRLNARYAHLEAGDTGLLLDKLEQAEAENERLLTRYACDVICGMGRRGNGSCSNPYDAECPALPDFIAAAKEASC